MFQLNQDQWENEKPQIATSRWGGRRSLPFVFKNQGVAMLSRVLGSVFAIHVNIHNPAIIPHSGTILYLCGDENHQQANVTGILGATSRGP